MDNLDNSIKDLSIEAERKLARTFMGRVEWRFLKVRERESKILKNFLS